MLFGLEVEVVERFTLAAAVGADNAVRTGEFGHDETATALITHEAAEDGVGDAGHGGEHGGGGDDGITDDVAFGKRKPVLGPDGIHSYIIALRRFGSPLAGYLGMTQKLAMITATLVAAVSMASCSRKEAVATGETPTAAAPEPPVIRESAFKPVLKKGSPMKPAEKPAEARPQPVIAKKPGPKTVTLAEGTVVAVRVGETMTSEQNQSGDSWAGVLAEPVVVDGLVIAERGAEVTGSVTNVKRSGRVKGVGTISITLSRLATADGQRVAISTTSFAGYGKDDTKRDVGKVAIVSGIGAAIGAIAGGGKGAAIGAGAGAGAGTGVVLATRGGPAIIANESLIRFKISTPATITEVLK